MGYRIFVDLYPPRTVEVIIQGQTLTKPLDDPLPCEVKHFDSARGILSVRVPNGKEWTILSVRTEPLPDATLTVQRLPDGRYELLDPPPVP
jgi:hypothetical protein